MGGLLDASTPSTEVVSALSADASQYTWVAAAIGSQNAAGLQLASGLPVMAIGGFNGSDPSPDARAVPVLRRGRGGSTTSPPALTVAAAARAVPAAAWAAAARSRPGCSRASPPSPSVARRSTTSRSRPRPHLRCGHELPGPRRRHPGPQRAAHRARLRHQASGAPAGHVPLPLPHHRRRQREHRRHVAGGLRPRGGAPLRRSGSTAGEGPRPGTEDRSGSPPTHRSWPTWTSTCPPTSTPCGRSSHR